MGKLGFDAFWGELSPCSHVVQICENDWEFLAHLIEFTAGGLIAGESVVLIVTPLHRHAIAKGLLEKGFDFGGAIKSDQLIILDAQDTVAKFLVGEMPDEQLFHKVIGSVLERATRDGRKVRAFGEMVA